MTTLDTRAPTRQSGPPEPVPPERAPALPPRRPILLVITLVLGVIAAGSFGWALHLHRDTTRLAQENVALEAELSTLREFLGDEGDMGPGVDTASARPLEPGAAVSVEGPAVTFEVAPSEGDLLIATVEPVGPNAFLELYDAAGWFLGDAWAEDADVEEIVLQHLFVGADPVYLVAGSYDGGDVVLSVEIVALGPAERVLDLELRAGNLPSSHLVEVTAGQFLDVRLVDRSGGRADPLVTVDGPDGQLVTENDDSGESLDARSITPVEEGGTHTIVADSFWTDDPEARLQLTVDVLPLTADP
jgi:hypothetical protein